MRRHDLTRRPVPPVGRRLSATGLAAALVFGCGPSPDDPLPSTDDLYVYSLAVAEKARLRVPEGLETRALHNLGQVHERFGFEDKALEEYSRVVERNANFGAAYERIGFILSQRGNRMAEAIEAYQQALRCEPDALGVHTRLALIHLHQGRLEHAIEAIEREHAQPDAATAESYYCLGQAYSKQGRTAEAIAALRDALRRDPKMLSAHYALAMELKIAGDAAGSRAALEQFRELKAADPSRRAQPAADDEARSRELRFAARTWVDAADLFHRAAGSPLTATSQEGGKASGARTEKLLNDALEALERAVQLDGRYDEAWAVYFDSLRAQKRLESALHVARRATEAISTDGSWPYRGALLELELARSGNDPETRYNEAVALLEEATRRAPEFAAAHFTLAHTVLMALNAREGALVRRAVQHATTAVELDPAPAHYDLLAFGHHLTGRPDLARQCLEEGIRRNPGASTLRSRLDKLRRSLESPR